MDILSWLKQNDVKALKTYERSFLKFDDLKVGQKMMSLRGGFGSKYGGTMLEIKAIEVDSQGRKFLTLKSVFVNDGCNFLLYEKAVTPERRDWYFDAAPVSEDQYNEYCSIKTRNIPDWQFKNFGTYFINY